MGGGGGRFQNNGIENIRGAKFDAPLPSSKSEVYVDLRLWRNMKNPNFEGGIQ